MIHDFADIFRSLSAPGPLSVHTLPKSLPEPHYSFCEAFCRYVVTRFLDGDADFWSAHRAISRLYLFSYHSEIDRGMPDLAWLVYEAFEEGEYRHDGDDDKVDPVEKYVRPLLAGLVNNSV